MTAFLRNASAAQALCIVLEDLQDGDKGTMELLVHLARNLSGARLLIVGTYRDVEVDRRHPLSAALADLRRVESFSRIALRGLSIDEVQRMLSNIAGQDVPYALAEAIYRQTEGNPLFIQEVARYIAESGLARREGGQWVATVDSLLTQIPEGLRDVIGKRLSRLSEECNRILSIAAVMGRDFSLDVLRDVAGVPEEQLLGAIEEAIGVSLLEEHTQGARRALSLHARLLPPDAVRRDDRAAAAAAAQRRREGARAVTTPAASTSTRPSWPSTSRTRRPKKTCARPCTTASWPRSAPPASTRTARRRGCWSRRCRCRTCSTRTTTRSATSLLDGLANALLSAGEPKRVSDEIAPEMFAIAERLGDSDRAAAACWLALEALARQDAGPVFATPEWAMWTERMYRHAAPD